MIGEIGEAEVDVAPDGVVLVRGARWRARTNRATPIAGGRPDPGGRGRRPGARGRARGGRRAGLPRAAPSQDPGDATNPRRRSDDVAGGEERRATEVPSPPCDVQGARSCSSVLLLAVALSGCDSDSSSGGATPTTQQSVTVVAQNLLHGFACPADIEPLPAPRSASSSSPPADRGRVPAGGHGRGGRPGHRRAAARQVKKICDGAYRVVGRRRPVDRPRGRAHDACPCSARSARSSPVRCAPRCGSAAGAARSARRGRDPPGERQRRPALRLATRARRRATPTTR